MSDAPDWLERNLAASGKPRTLTPDERRCVEVMSSIAALHNLNTPTGITESVDFEGGGVSILLRGELATYDHDALTRLVISAHVHAVRVAIAPWVSHLDEGRAQVIAEDFRTEYDIEIDQDAIAGIIEVRFTARLAGVTDQCWDGHPTPADLISAVERRSE